MIWTTVALLGVLAAAAGLWLLTRKARGAEGAQNPTPAPSPRGWVLGGLTLIILLAALVFWRGDAERSDRPSQAAVEALIGEPPIEPDDSATLVQQLQADRAALQTRPDDITLLMRISAAERQLGRFRAAHQATGRVLDLLAEAATAEQWTGYGLLQVYAAGGEYVSPEAEAAFRVALDLDPNEPMAQFYIGLLHAQTGQPARAFELWRPLIDRGPEDAPWVLLARARIEDAAKSAGIEYDLPVAQSGLPEASKDSDQATQEPANRQDRARLEGVVARFSDMLATEGGPPEAWIELIQALLELGRDKQAIIVLNEARKDLNSLPEAFAVLEKFAAEMGIE